MKKNREMDIMEVLFLGTSASMPTQNRNHPAIAIRIDGDVTLLDCGDGTLRQFIKSEMSFMKIKRIFISHYHGDHILGLPAIIQSMCLLEREKSLDIYGPIGLKKILESILSISYFSLKFKINVYEIEEKDTIELDKFKLLFCNAIHSISTLSICIQEKERAGKFYDKKAEELNVERGPKFSKLQSGESVKSKEGKIVEPKDVIGPKRPGRKIVYSADTTYNPKLIEFAKNSDLLIHEATYSNEIKEMADLAKHSTAQMAAKIAKKANVFKLYLVHISPRYEDNKILLDEAKKYFENTYVAEDFEKIEIKYRG